MTSKEQELKALEEIAAIIRKVGGANSYIGMTFDGCIDLASYNIENDFAISYKQKAESAEKEIEKLKTENKSKDERIKADEIRYHELDEKLIRKNNEIEILESRAQDFHKKLEEEIAKNQATNEQIKTANNEIIELKAKLYDLMTK